jgi:hypothetical protein
LKQLVELGEGLGHDLGVAVIILGIVYLVDRQAVGVEVVLLE